MIVIPPRMRKNLKCSVCGTERNVKFKGNDGKNYCNIHSLEYSNNHEDRNVAAIARTMRCSEGKARQVTMEARSRL